MSATTLSTRAMLIAGLASMAGLTHAQTVLFSESFDTDPTANWTVNSFVGGTTSSGDVAACSI